MNKSLLSILFLILTLTFSAQEKLTLAESVSGAYSLYYPASVANLSWAPDEMAYVYSEKVEDDEVIYHVDIVTGKKKRVIDTFALSKLFVAEGANYIDRFTGLEWKSSQELIFLHDGYYWNYNVGKSALQKISKIAAEGANHDATSDHKKIAFTNENNLYITSGLSDEVQVTKHDDKNVVSGQAIHRYEFGIGKGTFWAPNGNSLAFYEKNESMVTDYPLLSYGAPPADHTPVKYPMAGQKSHQAKVGIYNTEKDATVYLKTGELDDHYLTNLTWGKDGNFIYLAEVNRDQNHMHLNKYDAATGKKIATLFEEQDKEYVEPEHGPYFLDGTEGDFLWFSERDGFNHLYRYDANGKLISQVTKGDFVVLKILDYNSSTGNLIVSGTRKPTETVAYQVNVNGGEIKVITNEPGTHRVKVSSDGKHILDSRTSLDITRQIKVRDLSGKEVYDVFTSFDPLQRKQIGSTELYTINAEDGTDLWCRMIKPSNFDENKKYPVLVYVYGGPHAQMVKDTWLGGASLWMHYMAERGYIVFTLDNRGSANRGIEFEQAVHRNLGDLELADQLKGVEHLKSLKYVDSNKMAIHGWSYGGFMTTSMMTRNPDVFKVGVAGGPVIDWSLYEIMYTERYMDTPAQNPEGFAKSKVSDYVPNLKGDLLLIHGTIDDVVVMQHSMEFLKKCVDEGKQVDFFVYPGHKHNVRGKDRIHLMTKVLNYIEDKLETN